MSFTNIGRGLHRHRDEHVYRTSAGEPVGSGQTLIFQWPVGPQASDPSVRLNIQGLLDQDLLKLASELNLSERVSPYARHVVQNTVSPALHEGRPYPRPLTGHESMNVTPRAGVKTTECIFCRESIDVKNIGRHEDAYWLQLQCVRCGNTKTDWAIRPERWRLHHAGCCGALCKDAGQCFQLLVRPGWSEVAEESKTTGTLGGPMGKVVSVGEMLRGGTRWTKFRRECTSIARRGLVKSRHESYSQVASSKIPRDAGSQRLVSSPQTPSATSMAHAGTRQAPRNSLHGRAGVSTDTTTSSYHRAPPTIWTTSYAGQAQDHASSFTSGPGQSMAALGLSNANEETQRETPLQVDLESLLCQNETSNQLSEAGAWNSQGDVSNIDYLSHEHVQHAQGAMLAQMQSGDDGPVSQYGYEQAQWMQTASGPPVTVQPLALHMFGDIPATSNRSMYESTHEDPMQFSLESATYDQPGFGYFNHENTSLFSPDTMLTTPTMSRGLQGFETSPPGSGADLPDHFSFSPEASEVLQNARQQQHLRGASPIPPARANHSTSRVEAAPSPRRNVTAERTYASVAAAAAPQVPSCNIRQTRARDSPSPTKGLMSKKPKRRN